MYGLCKAATRKLFFAFGMMGSLWGFGACARRSAAEEPIAQGLEQAIFAAGCFWCAEADFEKLVGVVRVTSGYAGGKEIGPTYEQVSSGRTGHAEAIEVVYDPKRISYERLVDYFWRHIDPTVKDRQF